MADRTAELEARIAMLEERLAQREGRPRAVVDNAVRSVFPDEARRHMKAAWREQLMAVRSVLDHWIERQGGGEKAKGRESIRIE